MSSSRYVFAPCNYVILIQMIKLYQCRLLCVIFYKIWYCKLNLWEDLIHRWEVWIVPLGNVQIEFFHFPSTLQVPWSTYCWKTCLSNISLDTQMLWAKKLILPLTQKQVVPCKPLSGPPSLSFSHPPPSETFFLTS